MGLGANLGDARAALHEALRRLGELPGVRAVAVSPCYVTEPQDKPDQPWFHNMAAALTLDASWTPEGLLDACQAIEADMGRPPENARERFGPRPLDLDLLVFGHERRDTPKLILPHPRMRRRAFVLVPLADVAPDLVFPDGMDIATALSKIPFKIQGNSIFQDS